jgi:hypothetical protein
MKRFGQIVATVALAMTVAVVPMSAAVCGTAGRCEASASNLSRMACCVSTVLSGTFSGFNCVGGERALMVAERRSIETVSSAYGQVFFATHPYLKSLRPECSAPALSLEIFPGSVPPAFLSNLRV